MTYLLGFGYKLVNYITARPPSYYVLCLGLFKGVKPEGVPAQGVDAQRVKIQRIPHQGIMDPDGLTERILVMAPPDERILAEILGGVSFDGFIEFPYLTKTLGLLMECFLASLTVL